MERNGAVGSGVDRACQDLVGAICAHETEANLTRARQQLIARTGSRAPTLDERAGAAGSVIVLLSLASPAAAGDATSVRCPRPTDQLTLVRSASLALVRSALPLLRMDAHAGRTNDNGPAEADPPVAKVQ